MEKPEWAEELHSVGTYYEGFVGNLDCVLEKHKILTLTSCGTRTSHVRNKLQSDNDSSKARHALCAITFTLPPKTKVISAEIK